MSNNREARPGREIPDQTQDPRCAAKHHRCRFLLVNTCRLYLMRISYIGSTLSGWKVFASLGAIFVFIIILYTISPSWSDDICSPTIFHSTSQLDVPIIHSHSHSPFPPIPYRSCYYFDSRLYRILRGDVLDTRLPQASRGQVNRVWYAPFDACYLFR